MLNEKLL